MSLIPSFDHLTTVFVVFLWPAWRTCKPSKVLLAYVPLFFFLSSFGLLVFLCVFFNSSVFCCCFFTQFYVPFKIISAHMRRANQYVGQKRENPKKNHLAHPQAELGLSHMCPVRGLNPQQTQPFLFLHHLHIDLSHMI